VTIEHPALQERPQSTANEEPTSGGDDQLSELEPVILRDGLPVWLRPIRPTDAAAITALFDRASQQSLLFASSRR